jgi:tetratricopeptide (TPR) repeat protein
MGTTLENVPDTTPYIHPPAHGLTSWAEKFSEGADVFRVGLVWAGNEQPDPSRSCPFQDLSFLFAIPGIRFYSLQVGRQDRFPVPPEFADKLVDHAADIRDFSDTAAHLAYLDLVITIDTAVAHLAGAMGKTVWTLLPFVPDWRWLLERQDSPWYPTMRLYRQRASGDWGEVIGRVRAELLAYTTRFHNLRGIRLLREGQPAAAAQAFSMAIAAAPANAEAYCNRGVALDAMYDHDQAIAYYRDALSRRPDFLQAFFNMGNSLRSKGNDEAARSCYQRAVDLDPRFISAHLCLGEIDKAQKNFLAARAHFEDALAIDSCSADAIQGIAEICHAEEKLEEALAGYQTVLDLDPTRAETWNMSGTIYHCLQRVEEAEACYRKALELEPEGLSLLNNLGSILNTRAKLQEAVSVFRHLLEINDQYAEGHWNMALALLGMGEYAEGWREYEWRFRKANPVPERNLTQPRWDGSTLGGKTILVYAEQGFGDTLQFIRYTPMVAGRGGKVIVECQVSALKRLLESCPGVAEVVVAGSSLPHFDCHVPLLSLPLLFGTTLETIPASVPYLKALPADVEKWRMRLGEKKGLRVGLVWYGRQDQVLNRKRSCPLELFSPLGSVPNVEFYSLQIGEGAEQLKEGTPGLYIKDLTGEITDFADTAAFIANLDLVVTIDTAVAHLAGAVGAQTWVILPYGADWRWLQNRSDSPWYPTMRLFRQQTPGDWAPVLVDVAEALGISAEEKSGGSHIGKPPLPGTISMAPTVQPDHSIGPSLGGSRRPRVGITWSGRQDNPLNRKRSCPISALAPIFSVPNVDFINLQLGAPLDDKTALPLADLTDTIRDFEDTAALMENIDLIISIDTSVAHLAGSLGRPTWVLLSHVADWRWLTDREDSPWYPRTRLFRQPDFGDWDDVINDVVSRLSAMVGDQSRVNSNKPSKFSSPGSSERLFLEQILERHCYTLELTPNDPDSILNVGVSLALLGRYDEAIDFFTKALSFDSEHVAAHLNLSYCLLALGEYSEGWRHFQWRLHRIDPAHLPPWPMLHQGDFGNHRKGTSLLVHCEQGYGDTIQFSRFIPLLYDAGYRVVVSCQPPLAGIISSVRGVDLVVPHGEILPQCELQVPLLSLPSLLQTTLQNLPANIPYLAPRPEKGNEWQKRLDTISPPSQKNVVS